MLDFRIKQDFLSKKEKQKVAINGKKGANVNQEREYEITPFPAPFSTIQEIDVFQNITCRLVHTVKKLKRNPINILEICFGESCYMELLQDVFPDADLFLLNLENTTLIEQQFPDQFDVILVSPNGYLHQCDDEMMNFCHSKLKQGGLFASIMLGSDMFMELSSSMNFVEADRDWDDSLRMSFPTKSQWQDRLQQNGLSIWESKEEWYRKTYSSSRELFQIAAMLGFFQTVDIEKNQELQLFFQEWMKFYDRGFRTKEGRIYTTHHLIELIGFFL